MTSERVEVYRAANPQEAHLIKNLLADRDIIAEVQGGSLEAMAGGELPIGWASAPRLFVDRKDEKKTREFLLKYEEQRGENTSSYAEASEAEGPWPTCPVCGEKRKTVCPICETGGDDFHPAEYMEAVPGTFATEAELLMCTVCDEPFPPRYYDRCAACDHIFPDGIEAAAPAQDALILSSPEPLNPRVLMILGGLGLLLASSLLYFWVILRM